jgi:integrase
MKETTQTTSKKYEYYRSTFYFNGKQYSATSSKSPRDADRKADAKKLAMERGETATGGDMTVGEWAQLWLDTYKAPSIGESQYSNYEMYINALCAGVGGKRLKDVAPEDLQRTLNMAAGKSSSYISHYKYAIQAIFKRARISRHVVYDPAEDLAAPSGTYEPRRSVTPDERRAILALAETHRAGLWIKTMLYCGLRPGETRALEWRHIDIENGLIHVEQSVKAVTEAIGAPKTAAGVRDIPIPPPLLDALKTASGAPDEPVFRQPTTGKRHTKASLRKLWESFLRELDISLGAKLFRRQIIESKVAPDLVPYCMRHTYGTDLQDAGVPLNVAKYLMGHSDIAVTANVYTHTTGDAIAAAAKMLGEYHAASGIDNGARSV